MPYKEISDKLDNNKKWKINNPDKVKAASKDRWSNPEKRKKSKISRMKSVYKLCQLGAEEVFNTMECDICHMPISFDSQSDGQMKAVVDHCHDSGVVRGVLCGNCNTGLGYADDNIEILYEMIEYLKIRR